MRKLAAVFAAAFLLVGCSNQGPTSPEPKGEDPELSGVPVVRLLASDGQLHDLFGYSVSLDGDRAVVGAPGDDDQGARSGSAYVFVLSGGSWSEEAKLLASDGQRDADFGRSVSLDGDRVVVGAPGDDVRGLDQAGSAYVFVLSGGSWSEEVKLTASDGEAADGFGRSVSLDGGRVVVGTPGDDDKGVRSGSAYVFVLSGGSWSEEVKLTASDGEDSDDFGRSVSLDGDRVVVGTPGDDDKGTASGSAYVFVRIGGSWSEEMKLTASDGANEDDFGGSVSVNGDRAVVGAPGDDDKGTASGSAYVFVRIGGSWSEEVKLTASDGANDDHFGRSVSVNGDRAVVGAPQSVFTEKDAAGSAYVFDI